MQGTYLTVTIGFQFFLIVGYMLFAIFRTYPTREDSISLMSWITGFIALSTFGLVGLLLLVVSVMPISDVMFAFALVFADIVGLYLIIDDTLKKRKQTSISAT
jgi:hypothetical protein